MKLSEHFDSSEFTCHCCGELPEQGMDPALLEVLERVREYFDAPVTVVSGYRCPKHNAEVGGARSSQHLLGTAADIRVKGIKPYEVYRAVTMQIMVGRGGVGKYPTFTHVDVRRNFARW
jgi:uncharacterized protein YcbK (DUF882 family)